MEHVSTPFRTKYGAGLFHCFSFGPHEEDNILVIEAKPGTPVEIVRVQSACYTAEIFRSTDCDCHEQLDESLRTVFDQGGLVIYMLCDGRGAGLLTKVKALRMWEDSKIDTHDAYKIMNVEPDPREYDRLKAIVAHFDIKKVKLLTNNPRKVQGLEKLGVEVERVPLIVSHHPDATPYIKTKATKFQHMFDKK